MKFSGFSMLQKIGQSLMIPVSVLPAAGLLVAAGRVLQNLSEHFSSEILKIVGDVIFSGGLAIFEHLPIVFAVGVAIGFTSGAGVAALAAVVGYFTLANVLTVMTTALALSLKIDTGVFGGILIGGLSAYMYNHYQGVQLPPVLGFFSGKRLVPILTAATAILVGLFLAVVWPPIQTQIEHFGMWALNSNLGPAFYAAGKRLLIPVGLHHVYYPPFLYQFGEFTTVAGQVVHGDTARYFAGDPTAGRFMASEFPLMLFGLPAAALAIYLRALPARRKAIGGIMLAAALTSIITGITEPIEFAFIFVAPILYAFHVLMAFVSGCLTAYFDVHLGYTFSASLIDWFLGYFNQQNSKWLFFFIGPVIALLYFFVFYFAIGIFNLKTPGRESEDSADGGASTGGASEKAVHVLAALGGAKNIVSLEACITRLRLDVKDSANVNEKALKVLGASGVMKIGTTGVQVVFGVESDLLKEQIKNIMLYAQATQTASQSMSALKLQSPCAGTAVYLENVPDETFSQRMLGDGIAIDPTDEVMLAPCNGEIMTVFPTHHALGLHAENGAEVLIHIGLDTVKMKGDGFSAFVKVGDKVKTGQKLLGFSREKILAAGHKTISPIVITNSDDYQVHVSVKNGEKISLSSVLLSVDSKK